ncbi:MAG: hypothetical protein LHW56_01770 [Candidatus Cloacimonetes bacterium]|nr:hypothetical protein [Candidatus Cloacimonadota bacterium]MDY0171616.1 DNA polymerase [Candidatus Cloacimonadaceae bacterium]
MVDTAKKLLAEEEAICLKPTPCTGCRLYTEEFCKYALAQHQDITFIAGFPMDIDAEKGAYCSKGGWLLRNLVSEIKSKLPRAEQFSAEYIYAVRCVPKELNYKIKQQDLEKCSHQLQARLDLSKPKLLIPLGADAAKALGFRQKHGEIRGVFQTIHYGGVKYTVLPTISPVQVLKETGYITVLKRDIEKAFGYLSSGINCDELDIRTPTDCEGIVAQLDECLAALDKSHAENKKRPVAVDTETTSLLPHDPKQRCIMVSMSWEDNQGLAFPWEHRALPFSKEHFQRIRDKLLQVMHHPAFSLVMHNSKFDQQWLRYHEGLKTPEVTWDTMLIEHQLDEGKKGEYSLKVLATDYFPTDTRYEEDLEREKLSLQKARKETLKEAVKAYREKLVEAYVSYWLSLTDTERRSLNSRWISRKFLSMTESKGLTEPKYKKSKGELVLTKKSAGVIFKLLSKVPREELLIPLEFEPPEITPEVTYEDLAVPKLLLYAAVDGVMTRKIMLKQLGRLKEEALRVLKIEKKIKKPLQMQPLMWTVRNIVNPMADLISEMEFYGVRLDRERTKEYIKILEEKMAEVEDKIFTDIGYTFPLSNGNAIAKYLYEDKKLPIIKKTDAGAPCTDAETIKFLSDDFPDDVFLNYFLDWRRMEKIKGTYLNPWLQKSALDGFLHGKYHQNGTATSRLSSSDPNLQNVPFLLKISNLELFLNLKALFLPDNPEEEDFYDLDIANAEMRVLTAYSRDLALTQAFLEDKDLHCLTAAGLGEYSYEDLCLYKEDKSTPYYVLRQIAKKVNFGTIYMMSAKGLAAQLWSDMRIRVSEQEAQEYLDKFFKTYPGVARYIRNTINFALRHKFSYTFTGRKRRYAAASYNSSLLNGISRQAVNARIQTTSNDLVQTNMIDLREALRSREGRIILTVHDSIGFKAPKGQTGMKQLLDKIIMENIREKAPWLPVPWKYDVGYGPSYGEAKKAVA